ncbi:transglutaminase-like domain-containing protein [Maribellus maritimus]|uniref:transglutaminase-like domain-containing protein n=1 Tax=Maribellus maritimus TaxID=2870838 RepID=UPI001EEB1BEC|nr:transglutaminase-like domain-containing protein [Maribellus maritimus]MCG6188120.1 transglutaminase-like domain-containing protein [Maribellus maritimus]
MNKRKLQALIDLLDDPDELVYELVEKELLKENYKIIPALEEKWELSFDESSQERIENLIQSLQFKQTQKLLEKWIGSADHDLLSGFLLVDRFQYPDLNLLKIDQKIDNLRKSVWLELSDSLTILEKTTILNHFLFNINGFSINHNNIHSPQNCFLNQVLDTKRGNPISISVLYVIIARMLELPTHLIDFPRNPLIAIVDPNLAEKVHGNIRNSDVLFYINPSNKGSITSRKEIEYHLRKNKYEPLKLFTEPKTDLFFIQRLLESLEESYQSVGFQEKEEKIKTLLRLF